MVCIVFPRGTRRVEVHERRASGKDLKPRLKRAGRGTALHLLSLSVS